MLEKEGPIHDFAWNPNSREFAVTYGYVPARTTLFDAKANEMHSFGTEARNYLKYQPQGRLLLSAGFGNLNGNVDIWDLRSRKKVCEFSAPNSTVCEWSPCGRFILTGILSPRLRVDNGVKVWWCAGKLLHVQLLDELYQVCSRTSYIRERR
jgi:translation initiation factor 2A